MTAGAEFRFWLRQAKFVGTGVRVVAVEAVLAGRLVNTGLRELRFVVAGEAELVARSDEKMFVVR